MSYLVVTGKGAGGPPSWFISGKAPPGWKRTVVGGKRTDLCPRCKETIA